jgi:hypothetical protein
MRRQARQTQATIVNTLREVGWLHPTLYEIADEVERWEPGDACCPLCEEMTCDEGCPMAEARQLQGKTWDPEETDSAVGKTEAESTPCAPDVPTEPS